MISSLAASPALATDSLATPISGMMAKDLWPIEVSVELARVQSEAQSDAQSDAGPTLADPLPIRTVVVPDGHRLRFSSTVPTRTGKRRFELTVVPNHHPDSIEVEWDLEVHEALFRPIGWKRYVEHRLGLADSLSLGEERLKIARSDFVRTEDDHVVIRFEVDGESFEIRMLAVTTRG